MGRRLGVNAHRGDMLLVTLHDGSRCSYTDLFSNGVEHADFTDGGWLERGRGCSPWTLGLESE